MKKFLCTLLALTIILSVLPAQAFAKSDTVTLYGNKISVHAKQICFVKGSKNEELYTGSFYDSSFEKYHYVGDEVIDIKLIAEKLPELQSLVVIGNGVKNVSALSNLKDLVWLGFYKCSGTEDLSFLKNLTGLKKFRYENIYDDKECKSIEPVSYLKNLTELYLDVPERTAADIRPLKGLTKLKKLEMGNAGCAYIDVLKNLKNLRELDLGFLVGTTDMTFTKSLKKLEKLDIFGNTKNISAVKELKKLKELHIGDTREDLSFIGEMTQLEKLYLLYTNDTFAKKIVNLKNLKELSLSCINNGRPYDTSFITKLKSLESLKISDNNYYDDDIDISGISKLKNLKCLVLAECRFGNLSELKKCPALEEIIIDNCASDFDIKWIEGTNIKDLHISVNDQFSLSNGGKIKNMDRVTSLKKLEHLLLFFTGISEQSVKKIKKSLPNCKIEVWEFGEGYELETKIY